MTTTRPLKFEDLDEFDDFPMTESFREALADAELRTQLREQLIARRKELGLKQKQVATAMETTQSTISEFERAGGDPYLSTLQRYARAVGAEIEISVRNAHRAQREDHRRGRDRLPLRP